MSGEDLERTLGRLEGLVARGFGDLEQHLDILREDIATQRGLLEEVRQVLAQHEQRLSFLERSQVVGRHWLQVWPGWVVAIFVGIAEIFTLMRR